MNTAVTAAAPPDVFLRYQQRFFDSVAANALSAHEKSRRTGFSWAAGALAALTAAAAPSAGGMDALYMGYEREMTREFIDYVATWAKHFQIAAGEVEEFVFTDPARPDKDIGAFRIRFASGFEVIALPSVPRALRGKQGLVILDEAAFMDDLQEVLKAALALLIWGGRVVVISTHNGEQNAFNTLITDIRAGRRAGDVTRTTLDDALADGLYRRICFVSGKTWSAEAEAAWRQNLLDTYRDNADEELFVIPNPVSGVYLPGALLEARAVPDTPVFRWRAPAGFAMWSAHERERTVAALCEAELRPMLARFDPAEPTVFGTDFARVRDLSVNWFLGVGRDLVRRTRLVMELRDVPHEQQRQFLHYALDRAPPLRAGKMDAGGNGSYLAEVTVQKYGQRIEALQLSEPWYRDAFPPMRAALEDGMMTLPADREVIDDLRMVKLVRGVPRVPDRRRTAEGEQRHGDAAIAGVLAHAASRAEPEEYDYQGGLPPRALGDPGSPRWRDTPPEDEDDRAAGGGWLPELRGAA